jgi:hypothetical protein
MMDGPKMVSHLKQEIRSMAPDAPLTLSVPEAGRIYFGLSRNASYAAAKRGDIPTVQVGPKLLRAVVRALEQKLNATLAGKSQTAA